MASSVVLEEEARVPSRLARPSVGASVEAWLVEASGEWHWRGQRKALASIVLRA